MNILYLISILFLFGMNISNGIRDYIYVSSPRSFYDANDYCMRFYNTRLATIKSASDNNIAHQRCLYTCYVGITDLHGEGQWTNIDGSPALYTNWAPFKPNNNHYNEGRLIMCIFIYSIYNFAIYGINIILCIYIEDCVEISQNGQWIDSECARPKSFLCDAPGSGGNSPTHRPSKSPTLKPTSRPSKPPTLKPTSRPSNSPSFKPTSRPTDRPTERPTDRPVSSGPRDYVYVSSPMTFDGANAYCRNTIGTRLATIKTSMDNARADAVCTSKCYIGINDRNAEGYFINPDGVRATYTNWSPGEPNNVGNEDCVEIYAGGKWNDISCYSRKAFICDKPGASGPVGPRNYVYVSSPKTFYEAQSYCQNVVKTSLAKISNSADNSIAASQCSGTYFPYNQCFIGMNDRTAEGHWKNIDGSPVTYFNWNYGEPNNVGNEDCAEILSNGRMNDLPCSSRRAFLCNAPGSSAHQGNDIETNDIFNDNNIKNVNPVDKTGVKVYFIGLLSGVVLMMIMAIMYVGCKGIISNPRHKTYQYKSVTPKFTSDEDTSDV